MFLLTKKTYNYVEGGSESQNVIYFNNKPSSVEELRSKLKRVDTKLGDELLILDDQSLEKLLVLDNLLLETVDYDLVEVLVF